MLVVRRLYTMTSREAAERRQHHGIGANAERRKRTGAFYTNSWMHMAVNVVSAFMRHIIVRNEEGAYGQSLSINLELQ